MNSPMAYYNTKSDKGMSSEQFTEIVEAILAGKYSWACVLLLRFSGYNPLNYIPYRTYNRLTKENCQVGGVGKHQTHSLTPSNHHSESDVTSSQKCSSKISDLAYLEVVGEENTKVQGGNLDYFLNCKNPTRNLLKPELMQYLADYN